jgi:hypothetical protein
LAASPSCHSLNHFGANHSAALSSFTPALAAVVEITPAKGAASMINLRKENIRGYLVPRSSPDYLMIPIRFIMVSCE